MVVFDPRLCRTERDLDSQANTTFATGLMKFVYEEDDDLAENNVYHLIAEKTQYFIPDVVRKASFCVPSVDVVPSHINLTHQERTLVDKAFAKTRLLDKLDKVKDQYDFTIIDCPPSLNLYAQIALIAANYLLIPSDLKPFANEGLKNVKNFIAEIDEFRAVIQKQPINILGVLPSKVLTTVGFVKYSLQKLEDNVKTKYELPVLDSRIFERIDLAKCINHEVTVGELEIPDPKSIFDFSPDSMSAAEFEGLALEIMEKTGATK